MPVANKDKMASARHNQTVSAKSMNTNGTAQNLHIRACSQGSNKQDAVIIWNLSQPATETDQKQNDKLRSKLTSVDLLRDELRAQSNCEVEKQASASTNFSVLGKYAAISIRRR